MTWRLYINAIGFAAPGLDSSAGLFAHFDGADWSGPADWKPAPASLPRRQALDCELAEGCVLGRIHHYDGCVFAKICAFP